MRPRAHRRPRGRRSGLEGSARPRCGEPIFVSVGKGCVVKRSLVITGAVGVVVALATYVPSAASGASGHAIARHAASSNSGEVYPYCASSNSTCADPAAGQPGRYVGHDEPSVEYKSGVPGSGNDMTYTFTLPKDPAQQPNASGAGGTTWNFELRATFWFGLTMCDNQSAPEFTTACTPDSDANNLVGSNPKASDYIGRHPGTAFMELQFYGPGYVPQFEGFGCAAKVYCAAMTIDSRTLDMNHGAGTGTENTAACNNFIL